MTIASNLIAELKSLSPKNWEISLLEGVLGATMVLVVSFGFTEAPFKIASQLAVFACFVRPSIIRSPVLWLGLATLATASLISSWVTADNHKYLFAYWIWVVFFATYVDNEKVAESILRSHARFFLVFVFLVASMQKIASPTYVSGEMFEYKLLLDTRFTAFATSLGMDVNTAKDAQLAIVQLRSPATEFENNAVLLPSTDWVNTLAKVITWYDLLVQILIGVLFAIRRKLADILGHLTLLFFIFTTYIPAPVFGFGWTLSIYGYAMSKGQHPRLTPAYVATFIAILFYQLPWRSWISTW